MLSEMSVLIVDDYDLIRKLTRLILEDSGFARIAEASDGSSALAQLDENPVDLIISDWRMTPMDGISLLAAVRSDSRLEHSRFIMLSGENLAQNIGTARDCGADSYLIKPVSPELLRSRIHSVLGKPASKLRAATLAGDYPQHGLALLQHEADALFDPASRRLLAS